MCSGTKSPPYSKSPIKEFIKKPTDHWLGSLRFAPLKVVIMITFGYIYRNGVFGIRRATDYKQKLSESLVTTKFTPFESMDRFNVKGILSDHSSDSALNFHKIRDFSIFVIVLDVLT